MRGMTISIAILVSRLSTLQSFIINILSGYLLRSKYIGALKALDSSQASINRLNPSASPDELACFFQQELDYLESLKTELPTDTFAIDYIDILEKLEAKE
jgi:hypothetical protein